MGAAAASGATGATITVEVCYATVDRMIRQRVRLAAASRLADIRALCSLSPELALAWDQAAGFSVYGEKRGLQSLLEEGDRVELLRPLQADPKEARRLRAKLKGKG
jgi:putative ubiquitin-RnfH superfamily antitoxin RatB of RatAB toxin-antitoxin module